MRGDEKLVDLPLLVRPPAAFQASPGPQGDTVIPHCVWLSLAAIA